MQTDESVTALKHFWQKCNIRKSELEFNTKIENVLKMLAHITSIRAKVTALAIQQPEAVKRYTEINYNEHKDVFPLKLAYINFLEAKEKAGLERALLSAIFSQNTLEPEQFQQFIELVTVQEAYLNHDVML